MKESAFHGYSKGEKLVQFRMSKEIDSRKKGSLKRTKNLSSASKKGVLEEREGSYVGGNLRV